MPVPKLAIDGGSPVRRTRLPYGRQWITDEDVAAVVSTLRSEWLTTGPMVEAFETALAERVGAAHAIAVSSGTAALHAAVHALDLRPGDQVIVPAITFAATANCVLYAGATPVFVDVDPETLLIDTDAVVAAVGPRTRAVIAVDYAGQPCDYGRLSEISRPGGITIVADACHALGASAGTGQVGSLTPLTAFSFHPVKHAATGEGGAVTTSEPELASRMRAFRNHGIQSTHRDRDAQGSWCYDMVDLGFNYRLTDVQCSLGVSQLRRLDDNLARRRQIAAAYDRAFSAHPALRPLARRPDVSHAYHLYVVRLHLERLKAGRAAVFAALRAEGIGVNVHYAPVYLHSYYRQRFGFGAGLCPKAEQVYEEILTLPLFPAMTDRDRDDVIDAVLKVIDAYAE